MGRIQLNVSQAESLSSIVVFYLFSRVRRSLQVPEEKQEAAEEQKCLAQAAAQCVSDARLGGERDRATVAPYTWYTGPHIPSREEVCRDLGLYCCRATCCPWVATRGLKATIVLKRKV